MSCPRGGSLSPGQKGIGTLPSASKQEKSVELHTEIRDSTPGDNAPAPPLRSGWANPTGHTSWRGRGLWEPPPHLGHVPFDLETPPLNPLRQRSSLCLINAAFDSKNAGPERLSPITVLPLGQVSGRLWRLWDVSRRGTHPRGRAWNAAEFQGGTAHLPRPTLGQQFLALSSLHSPLSQEVLQQTA